MRQYYNVITAYSIMLFLIILVGIFQSWSIALSILNYCLISAVMTIGANLQWGYAGLINFGIMGYTALGGLAVVLISVAPVPEAWSAGGFGLIICLLIIVLMVLSIKFLSSKFKTIKNKTFVISSIIIIGIILIRFISAPAIENIESIDPVKTGFLGGLGYQYYYLGLLVVYLPLE